MNSKLLQYESLKIVLEHMEANKRFEISRHCPTIQKTEKIVPIYINHLNFKSSVIKPSVVSINSTDYRIGTIRVYPADAYILKPHQEKNDNGGIGTDLDLFGFNDFSSDGHLTLGDIIIDGQQKPGIVAHSNRFFEVQERAIESLESNLAQETQGELIEKGKRVIDSRRAYLLPYKNRRANTPAEFSTVVQLSVVSENKLILAKEFLEKKVYQVEKRLNEFLFGGRKSIHVRTLEVYFQYSVLRLPSEMSFKVRNLVVDYYTYNICKALSPIIHASCIPLNQVNFNKLDDSQHDLQKTARKLVIAREEDMGKFIERVTNQVVDVGIAEFRPQEYVDLVRKWLETQRPIGTSYSFGTESRRVMENTMKMIKRQLDGKMIDRQCVIVPIDESSQLKMYYEKQELDTQEQVQWKFIFKVVGV